MKELFTADFVLPIDTPPINRGGILVESGSILEVGSAGKLRKAHPEAVETPFTDAAILPGFVNSHSHLELTILRGALDDLDSDFAAWLVRLTALRRDALSDEDILASAIAGALEGLKAGVTCFGDIGRMAQAGNAALGLTGQRGVVFQETKFAPANSQADGEFRRLMSAVEELRGCVSSRVEIGISPHSPYTVSGKLFEMLGRESLESTIKLTIHAAESEAEQQLMRSGKGFFSEIYSEREVEWVSPGKRTVEYLEDTGVLRARPLLAHCVNVEHNEIRILADSGIPVAHCPKSNAKFGHGVAPVAEFLEKGIGTSLGTDSMASNNHCDMFEEMRFAVLASRMRDSGARFISTREALRMATLGGAEALGMDSAIGSLTPGKKADLMVVDLGDASRLPVNDIENFCVFSARAEDVSEVYIEGRKQFARNTLSPIDENDLKERLEKAGQKIRQTLDES